MRNYRTWWNGCRLVGLLALLWLTAAAPVVAQDDAAAARATLRSWATHVDTAVDRLAAGDLAGAEAEFNTFYDGWFDIEDDIRPVSRAHYREIERAMAEGRAAFGTRPPDVAAIGAAVRRLQAVNVAFIAGQPVPAEGEATAASAAAPEGLPPGLENPTPSTLIVLLDRLIAGVDRGDATAAREDLRVFQEVWLDVEGLVKTRSASVYVSTENRTAEVASLLGATPPNYAAAREALVAMRSDLSPIADAGSHYGPWDAAIILLREGFEALLVVAALLAFLQRSGNGDKQGWIWGGAVAGIGASMVVAVLAQQVLNRAAANVSREMLEGVTGLVAAAMLLYVGYWLHSKASLAAWQRYISDQSMAAIKQNSLYGLAVIAFLAVFREGAETVLFYVGIAPSISFGDLMLGLGIGVAGLVVLAAVLLVAGMRIPVRPFFLAATVLIYYLCLKFVGTGVHALQVSGVLPATTARYLPSWDVLGMYPTWETTLAQLAVLLIILAQMLLPHIPLHRRQPAEPAH